MELFSPDERNAQLTKELSSLVFFSLLQRNATY